jgi:hypothetical protein
MMHRHRVTGDRAMRRLAAALFACSTLGAAHADERNPLEARFIVDAGYFFLSTDTQVRVDGETTETYFQNNRHATRSIDRDVVFQDQTFPLGATVNASSELTIAQLSYDYAFLRRAKYEIAGGFGIHYIDMGLKLDATLTAPGGQASRSLDVGATTAAPMPVLGLRGLWRLSDAFYISAQLQYFYLEFDPYSGSLIDLKASVVWQVADHVGVGLGYNDFGFRFDIEDRGDFDGRLRWDYGGAFAFATFMF